MSAKKSSIVWFASWLTLVVTFAVGLGNLNWIRYYRLVRHGVPTKGVVTSLPDPRNHQFQKYEYTVGSRTLSSSGYPHALIGDTITPLYLPSDPTVTCLGDPMVQLKDESIPIGLASIIFPTLILFSVYRRSKLRDAVDGV